MTEIEKLIEKKLKLEKEIEEIKKLIRTKQAEKWKKKKDQ